MTLEWTEPRHQMLTDIRDENLRFDADGGWTCLRWRGANADLYRTYQELLNAFLTVPKSRADGGWDVVITVDGRTVLAEWDTRHGVVDAGQRQDGAA